jgi:hypothetical protein
MLGIVRTKPRLAFGTDVGFDFDLIRGVQVAFVVALAAGGLIVAFALYRKWRDAIATTACVIVLLLLIANLMLMKGLDRIISARPAAVGLITAFDATPEDVAVYHLPRAYQYGLDYYFGKDLPEWTPENTRAIYIYFSKSSLAQMNQFPQSDGRTSAFFPATTDGKIYLRLDRPPKK